MPVSPLTLPPPQQPLHAPGSAAFARDDDDDDDSARSDITTPDGSSGVPSTCVFASVDAALADILRDVMRDAELLGSERDVSSVRRVSASAWPTRGAAIKALTPALERHALLGHLRRMYSQHCVSARLEREAAEETRGSARRRLALVVEIRAYA